VTDFSDLYIAPDVMQEVQSQLPLKPPGGWKPGQTVRWTEPIKIMGANVNVGGPATKLPEGKLVVEVSFKVADNGSRENALQEFRYSFWITKASLQSRAAMADDEPSKISVRTLLELAKAIDLDITQGLLQAFSGMNVAMLDGRVVVARISIKSDKVDPETARFNMNGFKRG